jgi:hypothetical protein
MHVIWSDDLTADLSTHYTVLSSYLGTPRPTEGSTWILVTINRYCVACAQCDLTVPQRNRIGSGRSTALGVWPEVQSIHP